MLLLRYYFRRCSIIINLFFAITVIFGVTNTHAESNMCFNSCDMFEPAEGFVDNYSYICDNYRYIKLDELAKGIVTFSNDCFYWGLWDVKSGFFSEDKYIHIYISEDPSNNYIALDEGYDNNMGFFSRKEKEMTIPAQYDGEFFTEFSEGYAWVRIVYDYNEDIFDLLLIDEKNQPLTIEQRAVPLGNFVNGRCRVYSEDTQLEGYIDNKGKIVIPLIYKDVRDFNKDGFAVVTDVFDKDWTIDLFGTVIVH